MDEEPVLPGKAFAREEGYPPRVMGRHADVKGARLAIACDHRREPLQRPAHHDGIERLVAGTTDEVERGEGELQHREAKQVAGGVHPHVDVVGIVQRP